MSTRTAQMPPSIPAGQEPPEDINVKIPRALHRKLKTIANLKGEELSDTVKRILTPPTDKEYREVMRKEAGE
jgi:hypothetical protein